MENRSINIPRATSDAAAGTLLLPCRCRNDVMHLDLQRELPELFCDNGGDISCFNSRQLTWKFINRPPSRGQSGLRLPGKEQFAWFCNAVFPWCALLTAHICNSSSLLRTQPLR